MSKKKPIIFFGILVLILILCGLLFFLNSSTTKKTVSQKVPQSNTLKSTVEGNSLSPLIEDGTKVEIQLGYYASTTPTRGEVVAYDYAGKEVPIIKIIKGMPGDAWRLEKKGDGYHIFVNNQVLKNSEGKEYLISESRSKMLQLYATTYPLIPQDSCLIMGDQIGGTTDSTVFGLVNLSDVLGKVNY